MTITEPAQRTRSSIRVKLCLLYLMNVADWICTVVLTRAGGYAEANPLMAPVIGELSWSFVLKCVLPAAALYLIDRLCLTLPDGDLRAADRWVCFAAVFYTAILLDHTINFIIWHSGAQRLMT